MVRETLFLVFASLNVSGMFMTIARIGKPRKSETTQGAMITLVISWVLLYLYYVMWKGHF